MVSVYKQFFGGLVGSLVALGLILLLSKTARQHVVAYGCMVVGQALTLPRLALDPAGKPLRHSFPASCCGCRCGGRVLSRVHSGGPVEKVRAGN
jgi:hypothetical protein